jgi:hypothetical protein
VRGGPVQENRGAENGDLDEDGRDDETQDERSEHRGQPPDRCDKTAHVTTPEAVESAV